MGDCRAELISVKKKKIVAVNTIQTKTNGLKSLNLVSTVLNGSFRFAVGTAKRSNNLTQGAKIRHGGSPPPFTSVLLQSKRCMHRASTFYYQRGICAASLA